MLDMRSQSVNVNRLALLVALKENRQQHQKIYLAAIADFKNEKLQALRVAMAEVEKDEHPEKSNLTVSVPKPVSYLKDYDQVIDMMEMSVDENINLDSASFQAYVKDNWSWKGSFVTMNAKYIS